MITHNMYIRNGAFVSGSRVKSPQIPNEQTGHGRKIERPDYVDRMYRYIALHQGIGWLDLAEKFSCGAGFGKRETVFSQLQAVGLFIYDEEAGRCFVGWDGWEMLEGEIKGTSDE